MATFKPAVKKSPKPPGSRTEQHSKTRLKQDFGGMSDMLRPKPKLRSTTKPRLK
jgi:hypothetical protein